MFNFDAFRLAAGMDGVHNLTLAGLVDHLAAVLTVLPRIRRLHVAAEVCAINFHVALERAFFAGAPNY